MTKRYVLTRISVLLTQVLAVALVVFLWQVLSDHHVLDPVYFSKPVTVWHQLQSWFSTGTVWSNIAETVEVFAIGYACGTAAGVVLGVLLGTVGWLRRLTEPFISFFNATPRLILLPLIVVWFGFGILPKVILVVCVIVVIVALNVAAGIREVRADLLNQARLMGASRVDLVRHVYGPSVALWVTTTARVTVGYALNATIAAEFIGANKGLGYLIVYGEATFVAAQIWAALVIVVVIAILVDSALALVEKRATRWMPTVA